MFETLGMGDVVAKCLGSRNPHNMVKATFAALQHAPARAPSPTRRGKKVSDLFGRRERRAPPDAGAGGAADA